MTEADRKFLLGIKNDAEHLARNLKVAMDHGFQITLNMDGATGTLAVFDVKQLVPLDIEKPSN